MTDARIIPDTPEGCELLSLCAMCVAKVTAGRDLGTTGYPFSCDLCGASSANGTRQQHLMGLSHAKWYAAPRG